ncbi:Lin1244/Lin1753 domain-containing protein [Polluticoccus soli]|uniref:Lin1244/Lin1753 domain-containing protein n=1 Tax=Polluticoccus soli TaxID=3034150 RepID=UPI0023E32F6F|nr:Lin1244/Lin1753 domain-containing protein [Flavipsychrobacter sp. JY13-12]
MKKQSTWFSHDSNASLDPKIIALTATHGIAGYGRWWRLVEILRAEERYRYNITTPFAYSVLAKELMCSTEEAKQFVQDCIQQYQLLQTDEEHIWSTSLCGRMEHMDTQKANYSKAGKQSAQVRKEKQAASLQQSSNDVETALQHSSTKEIKQNETKQNETTTTSEGEGEVEETVKEEQKPEADWQALKQQALQDTGFTYAIISTGKLNEVQLDQWLTAFNRILTIRSEPAKSLQDYRNHFLHWFKFRDPQKEDPQTFLVPEARNKAPTIINTQTFLKTPQQIEEERAQQEQWKNRIAR